MKNFYWVTKFIPINYKKVSAYVSNVKNDYADRNWSALDKYMFS